MTSTTYQIKFYNAVNDGSWIAAVWKTFPDITGSIPLAWKCTPLPKAGSTPSMVSTEWGITYDVFLIDQNAPNTNGQWESIVTEDSILGNAWNVEDSSSGAQQFTTPPDVIPNSPLITVKSNSNQAANVGFGMDGNVMAVVKGFTSGPVLTASFTPTYYVGLFNNVVAQQQLQVSQALGPQEIVFAPGEFVKSFTLTKVGNKLQLNPGVPQTPSTSFVIRAPGMAQVCSKYVLSADVAQKLEDLGCHLLLVQSPRPDCMDQFSIQMSGENADQGAEAIREYIAARCSTLNKKNHLLITETDIDDDDVGQENGGSGNLMVDPVTIGVLIYIGGITAGAIYRIVTRNDILNIQIGPLRMQLQPQAPTAPNATNTPVAATLVALPSDDSQLNGSANKSSSRNKLGAAPPTHAQMIAGLTTAIRKDTPNTVSVKETK
jgi:hypothetical protein